ncbi:uncharacterized protein J3D65DRAFT_606856 [Phyllosticta citribraziliensis]|uniref:Zn(2)-C6 fungal-type domain-containing protein n=1 Tax=Phyllosticta citribraziliensis TaxID=989973 RepID=A0ABR1L5U0_9PEZI
MPPSTCLAIDRSWPPTLGRKQLRDPFPAIALDSGGERLTGRLAANVDSVGGAVFTSSGGSSQTRATHRGTALDHSDSGMVPELPTDSVLPPSSASVPRHLLEHISIANRLAARLPSTSSIHQDRVSKNSNFSSQGRDMPAYHQRQMFRPILVGPSPPQLSSQSSDNTPSPTTTTPKLGSKRGRITAIACVPCKKRKSKCNGLQPVCNTCALKGSACSYDMRQEHRWQGTLRVNVKKLEQELEEVKSVLPLLATSSQREAATKLAFEISKRGFSEHSADEIRKMLGGSKVDAPQAEGSTPTAESAGENSDSKNDLSESPEDVTQYYPEFDQNVSPGFENAIPTASERRLGWSSGVVGRKVIGVDRSKLAAADESFSSKQNIMASSAADLSAHHSVMGFDTPVSPGTTNVSPITYVFAMYRDSKRAQRADGDSSQKVFGSDSNEIDAILGGETGFSQEQSLTTWVPRVVNVFFSAAGLAEKLAVAELVKDWMQWQIWPSRENLERLPRWIQPTQFQKVIPHDLTIDILPWPAVRDFFLHNPELYMSGDLFNHLSINWTLEDSRMFYCEPESGKFVLSAAFKEHIGNLSNWSFAPEVFEQMPYLIGKDTMGMLKSAPQKRPE